MSSPTDTAAMMAHHTGDIDGLTTFGIAQRSARFALNPIREWYGNAMREALDEDLYDNRDLLESLAPLLFSAEELA